MTKPDVHVVDSLYYDRFQEAKKGVLIEKTYLDIVRAQIEMTIRK